MFVRELVGETAANFQNLAGDVIRLGKQKSMTAPAASSVDPARPSAMRSLIPSIMSRVSPTRRSLSPIITEVSPTISWVRRVSI